MSYYEFNRIKWYLTTFRLHGKFQKFSFLLKFSFFQVNVAESCKCDKLLFSYEAVVAVLFLLLLLLVSVFLLQITYFIYHHDRLNSNMYFRFEHCYNTNFLRVLRILFSKDTCLDCFMFACHLIFFIANTNSLCQ